jgi:hypothetical protein
MKRRKSRHFGFECFLPSHSKQPPSPVSGSGLSVKTRKCRLYGRVSITAVIKVSAQSLPQIGFQKDIYMVRGLQALKDAT